MKIRRTTHVPLGRHQRHWLFFVLRCLWISFASLNLNSCGDEVNVHLHVTLFFSDSPSKTTDSAGEECVRRQWHTVLFQIHTEWKPAMFINHKDSGHEPGVENKPRLGFEMKYLNSKVEFAWCVFTCFQKKNKIKSKVTVAKDSECSCLLETNLDFCFRYRCMYT